MKTMKNTMSQHQRASQQGFTLIELVIVITIIGILAAVALPRFINLQKEARISKLNSVRGAVVSTAALVHSAALAKSGKDDSAPCPGTNVTADNRTSLCTESGLIAIANAYPASTAVPALQYPGIVGAAGLTTVINPTAAQLQAEGYDVTNSGNDTTFRIQGAPDPSTCQFVYTQSTTAGAAPLVGAVTTTGC